MKSLKWLLAVGCGLLVSCAIITVNVYFPEKAVKDAYKSLDEILLKKEGQNVPNAGKQPAVEPKVSQPGPQSSLPDRLPELSFTAVAQAAENGDDLAIELGSMPEVAAAYAEMSQRQSALAALFDSGAVGLTSQGLVSVRDKAKMSAQDEALVGAENRNRKTIIGGMAKAILKVTKQEATKAALDQTMGKAAATYAETRRESAKAGWWMQLQNGKWVQK
ncbi:DUF1318 domain-containing protein [Geobacter sp. AOG2]|uniref:DUF1318 domain-containing protein n=1 Tax=Geobacter sp. AOG2 TaxID=1566347 RepID=UPI001CC518C9|nr:DUF1318 domain-containing protein [Geobacter sp. AOG2]GFE59427.1 lipoprotein [Geobacter sp. AOG2]